MKIYLIMYSHYHDDVPWSWVDYVTDVTFLTEKEAQQYCDEKNPEPTKYTKEDYYRMWDEMSEEDRDWYRDMFSMNYFDDPTLDDHERFYDYESREDERDEEESDHYFYKEITINSSVK